MKNAKQNEKQIEELKEELKSLNDKELDQIAAGNLKDSDKSVCPPGYFKKDNKCWPL